MINISFVGIGRVELVLSKSNRLMFGFDGTTTLVKKTKEGTVMEIWVHPSSNLMNNPAFSSGKTGLQFMQSRSHL